MPQFEFHFADEEEAIKPVPKPKPRPTSAAIPAPGFGLDDNYEPLPYVAPVLTPAQEQCRAAMRAWSDAHEQMCGYTRYGSIPSEVAAHVEQLFQAARALAY
jgi:hypothetical protein